MVCFMNYGNQLGISILGFKVNRYFFTVFLCLSLPHFDYYSIGWGNCGITLRNKIQKLQDRAARVLTYSSCDVDAGHLFKLLGWKNLAYQQQIQRATMVYRSLRGLAPNYLSSKFERREVAYNLRDSERKRNVPFPRTNYYKNGLSYSGAILWNSLPCNLREAESLLFKYFYYISSRYY